MNKPITLCDRCKEYARCCLNYDGDNCRRSRTVEPTNADSIRSMSDEELALWIHQTRHNPLDDRTLSEWFDWLKQEAAPK